MPHVVLEETPDLILLDYGFLEIRYGVGDGTYISVQVLPPDTNNDNYGAFGFADVNGDGALDLYMQSVAPQNLHVGYGDGSGGFVFGSPAAPLDDYALISVSSDFDGDGDIDLLFGHSAFGSRELTLALNDGSGVFTETAIEAGAADGVYGLAAGDVDGDGDDDVVVIGSENVSLLINNGGTLERSFSIEDNVGVPASVELLDIDGDDDLDIVIGDVGRIRIQLNDGTGAFSEPPGVSPVSEGFFNDVGTGDFDGDGDIDLIGLDGFTDEVTLWRNGGALAFADTSIDIGGRIDPTTISVMDLDGDGDLDALIYSSGESATGEVPDEAPRATRLINDGTGQFTALPLTIPQGLSLTGALATFANAAIQGGSGADTLAGNAWADRMIGGGGNDNLSGSAGYDALEGGTGNDVLNGGTGRDTMVGGSGNDTYYVDNAGDTVTELNGGGTDTVNSSVTFSLYGGYVENLTLTGTGNTSATGNGSDNVIRGNSGNNIITGGKGADAMIGGAGNDTYYVDNVGDTVTEVQNAGTDTVNTYVTFSLYGGYVENLILNGSASIDGTGNGSNNTITGNSGNNVINGGKGADAMLGGAGNDTYVVDNAEDTVAEANGQGTDTVNSSVTFSLYGQYIENLTLTGSAAVDGTGTSSANVITGNGAINALSGGKGNDRIIGGLGADVLTGGQDNDTFVYASTTESTVAASDRITDLTNTDIIDLSAIDARTDVGGNNAFVIVSAFTGVSGQITLKYNAGTGLTSILMDRNGDGVADMRIIAAGDHHDFTNFLF